jgi:hypothetical protein
VTRYVATAEFSLAVSSSSRVAPAAEKHRHSLGVSCLLISGPSWPTVKLACVSFGGGFSGRTCSSLTLPSSISYFFSISYSLSRRPALFSGLALCSRTTGDGSSLPLACPLRSSTTTDAPCGLPNMLIQAKLRSDVLLSNCEKPIILFSSEMGDCFAGSSLLNPIDLVAFAVGRLEVVTVDTRLGTCCDWAIGSVASLVPKPVYGLDDSSNLPSTTRVIAY